MKKLSVGKFRPNFSTFKIWSGENSRTPCDAQYLGNPWKNNNFAIRACANLLDILECCESERMCARITPNALIKINICLCNRIAMTNSKTEYDLITFCPQFCIWIFFFQWRFIFFIAGRNVHIEFVQRRREIGAKSRSGLARKFWRLTWCAVSFDSFVWRTFYCGGVVVGVVFRGWFVGGRRDAAAGRHRGATPKQN